MSVRRFLACVSSFLAFALATTVSMPAAHAQVFGGGPWTGLYVGVHGGYGWTSDGSPDSSGSAGGIQAGYNLQLGQAVVGIEGDYTWGSVEGSGTVGALSVSGSIDTLWSIRGRLGWVLASNLMLYGTAGYGGFDTSLKTGIGGLNLTASGDASGLVVGGGAELLLTPSIMLRAEGLHYMGDGNGNFAGSSGDVTMLRAGVSYKF